MSDTHLNEYPYVNRDVSWMWFNSRILQEAMRSDVPLLERLSFLGIYSNNLDEFYRVRMATISHLADMEGKGVREQRRRAGELYSRLAEMDKELSVTYSRAVDDVTRELVDAGILILEPESLTEEQRHYLRCLFRNSIAGRISPLWLHKLPEFRHESDDHIWIAVECGRKDSAAKDYAVIELPTKICGRFVRLPDKEGKACVMYLDDVVRLCLPLIFPGMGCDSFGAYSFKFTKDAEMEIDNDLRIGPLQKVAKAVRGRRGGATMRFIYDSRMPAPLLNQIMKKLRLDRLDTVQGAGRHQNHKDFMSFPTMGRDDLRYPRRRQIVLPEMKGDVSLLNLVAEADRYIHVPYHSFDYFIRLLQEAAVSRDVSSLRITLYRVARQSEVIEALVCAARNGKKVTAVVELLARFDEESNISWAKKMQDAGINVIFGVEGLKIHCKLLLIGMKKRPDIAVISTGNFHEGNARVYTDVLLMTARRPITRDVRRVFDFIRHPYRPVSFDRLLVSPNAMRDRFLTLIDDEIKAARRGKEAWIKIKTNHITDEEMVRKLYEASQAGVRIELLVRGNFSAVTGVKGVSDNITATGIIDSFLEHSRIYIFCAGGKEKTFIGSADWMPRNLDNRVEVVAPVDDPDIRREMKTIVEYGLRDNTHGRIADGTGRNLYNKGLSDEPFRSQQALYDHYESQTHTHRQ